MPFTGITTLRDLGGYATAVGGVTRSGLVFGADALHKLTPDDLDAFGELGVQTVYDLRGDVERAEFPGPVPIPPRLLTGPAGLEPAELTAPREHLVDDRSSA